MLLVAWNYLDKSLTMTSKLITLMMIILILVAYNSNNKRNFAAYCHKNPRH